MIGDRHSAPSQPQKAPIVLEEGCFKRRITITLCIFYVGPLARCLSSTTSLPATLGQILDHTPQDWEQFVRSGKKNICLQFDLVIKLLHSVDHSLKYVCFKLGDVQVSQYKDKKEVLLY